MSLSRSFLIYTFSSVLASAVPLALLPVLTRYLSAAEYGTMATLTTLIALITPPLMWGATAMVSVEFLRQPATVVPTFLSSLLRLPLAGFVLLTLACTLAAPWVTTLLDVPALWFATLPLFALLAALPALMSAVLRMRNQAAAFGVYQVFSACVAVALSLLLVVVLDWHWQGRMVAIALSSLLCTVIALGWMRRERYLVRSIDRPLLRKALRFGSGVVPHELGSQAIRLLDRVFLAAMAGLASAGQYAVASQVASVMLILLSAFNRAWTPYLFGQLQHRSDAVDRAIVNKSYLAIASFALFLLGFNMIVPAAYSVFVAPSFHVSMGYVPWLTLGYFFTAVYLTYIDYVFYTGKTHVLAAITMFNLGCNVLLNYVLITRYGAIGAAYAFAGSMFVVMLVAFALSNRLHPMPWFHWVRGLR